MIRVGELAQLEHRRDAEEVAEQHDAAEGEHARREPLMGTAAESC